MALHVSDLFSIDEFLDRKNDGLIREQRHPSLPLAIANYTEACQYERKWDHITRQCRGLIYDYTTGYVVARPFPKFFNYGEHFVCVSCGASVGVNEWCPSPCDTDLRDSNNYENALDMDAFVEVTDKLDGSLGIAYPTPDGPAIATRGSFTSWQAQWATGWLRATYPDMKLDPSITYLFEILHPENRIVVNYGERAELVFLGSVGIKDGLVVGPRPDVHWWRGTRASVIAENVTLMEALSKIEPRPNAEGVVIHFIATDLMVKVKQEDYVALHRIMTGTNARRVWEMLVVPICAPYVREPKHWPSYLKIDPRDAEAILETKVTPEGLPDEFHAWVRDVQQRCRNKFSADMLRANRTVRVAVGLTDRRQRFEYVHTAAPDFEKEIMRRVEGREGSLESLILRGWLNCRPGAEAPFAASEDVA